MAAEEERARKVFGVPLNLVGLLLGGLLLEGKIRGSTTVAVFIVSLMLSKDY